MYIVYRTTNDFDNCVYVGVHKVKPKYDYYLGSGVRLIRAIKKYGADNFKRETLFECDCAEEAYWLEKIILPLWFVKRRDVYNLQTGGMGLSSEMAKEINNRPERKKAFAKYLKENNPMKYKKYRDKISKAMKGRQFEMTKEGSEAIAKSNVRRSKPVNCYDMDGNFIKQYPSAKIAMLETGTDEWRISLACRGKVPYAGTKKLGHMLWKYVENEKED